MQIWYYNDAGKLGKYPCASFPIFLGRDSACELPILEGSVSRKHASLSIINGRTILTDLDSTNGTFVNNVRIEKQTLADGDCIQLGRFICWYSDNGKPGNLPDFILAHTEEEPFCIDRPKKNLKIMRPSDQLHDNLFSEFKKQIENYVPSILDNSLARVLPWPEPTATSPPTCNLIQKCIAHGGPCLQLVCDKENEVKFFPFSFASKDCHPLPKIRSLKGVKHLAAACPINTRSVRAVLYLESDSPESPNDRFIQAMETIIKKAQNFTPSPKNHRNRRNLPKTE